MNSTKKPQKITFIIGIIIVIGFYLLGQHYSNLVVPAFCFFIGPLMLYAGGSLRSSSLKIKNFGIRTEARIIDYEVKGLGASNSKSFYPIIEFKTTTNETITHKLKLSESQKKLNSTFSIYYLKEKTKYKVIKDSKLWTTYYPFLYITVGTLLLLGGVIYLLKTN